MCMHSAECCPVYCFITVLGKGKRVGLTAVKNLHLRINGMRLEMTYFRAELVQLIISWSDSEIEVQRLIVAFALLLCTGNHPQWLKRHMICLFTAAELPCRLLSFHPLPSPLTTPAWVHVAARVCDRHHLGFHDEYQVTQMHRSVG